MELMLKVPHMTVEDATTYLDRLDLTEAEKVILLTKAGTKLKAKATEQPARTYLIDRDRPVWLVAAYLLGASLRQLALLHGVQHPTIAQSINKLMPGPERTMKRLKFTMTFEALSEYHRMYYNNLDTVREIKQPLLVAQWLIDNTELDK